MKRFRFETGEGCDPKIVAPGEVREIAEFLMQHACTPEQIDVLIERTDSVLTGRARREALDADNARLEIDGGQYVARVTRAGSDTRSGAATVIALGTFRDLLVEWRNFVTGE